MGLMQLMPDDGSPVPRAQPVRSRQQHRSRHEVPQTSCSTSSSCRSRSPPTTPAKAPCAGSAAFRRMPKLRHTSIEDPRPIAAYQAVRCRLDLGMEFRCRLVTAAGEIVEGNYAAESEARLRHDFEAQGLHVLSLRKRGALTRRPCPPAAPQDRPPRISRLQSGICDPAQGRHAAGAVDRSAAASGRRTPSSVRARRCAREGPRRECAVRRLCRITAICFRACTRRRCWPASEAATSTRSSPVRRVREGRRHGQAQDDFGADLPGHSHRAGVGLVGIIVLVAVPAFTRVSMRASTPSCRCRRASYLRCLISPSSSSRCSIAALAIGGAAFAAWIRRPGQRARFDHVLLTVPFVGETVRKFTTAQMARTLATLLGGGIPLVNCAGGDGAIGQQPAHGRASSTP